MLGGLAWGMRRTSTAVMLTCQRLADCNLMQVEGIAPNSLLLGGWKRSIQVLGCTSGLVSG